MPKNRNSNREPRKRPAMTMMEKRAVKKSKNSAKGILVDDNATRRPFTGSGTRRS